MIETFGKIWQFAGEERKNINKSVWVSLASAILQMFQIGAIYLVVRALTLGAQGGRTAWLALALELVSIFGGAVLSSHSKMYQTHAGYFMAADRRIAIADRMKSVPMGFFNDNSLGQLSGVWRIDMTKCPYHDACVEHGCPELCPCFCDSDDIAYDDLHPKLLWRRTKTLGRGGDCCDFCLKLAGK